MKRLSSTSIIMSLGVLLLTFFIALNNHQTQAAEILTVTSPDPDNILEGYASQEFVAQFTASGSTITPPSDPGYVYSFSGLPAGISPNTITGEIRGTAGVPGEYPVTVSVSDANGDTSAPLNVTLCLGILIEPITLPPIVTKKAYSQAITTKCNTGTTTYTVTGGALPSNFALDTNTGVLSGTTNDIKTHTFTITATNTTNSETASRTYTVISAEPVFTYSPANLPNGTSGIAYNSTHTISGGTSPYTIVNKPSTSLPTGYTYSFISPNQFRVAGTSNATGAFHLDLEITDATGVKKDVVFNFNVNAPALTIDQTTLPNATQGVNYSFQLTASGGNEPYTFTLPAGQLLPTNFTLSTSGLIDMRNPGPVRAGGYTITVVVQDSSTPQRTGSRVFNLLIVNGAAAVYSSNPAPGSTINFGLVTVPGSSIVQTLAVTNSGSVNLTLSIPDSGAIFTGTNAADFQLGVSLQPPFSIAPNGTSVTLVITCKPNNTLFASVAVMTFKTNDPARPSVSYGLVCNQTAVATPGPGTATAVAGTAGPSVQVLSRGTAVVTEAPKTIATVTFVKGLSLRSGPYLGATMLGVIRPKKEYPVLAFNPGDGNGDFSWYLLVDVDNNRVGWASGRYLILKGDPNIPLTPTVFDQIDNAKDFGVRLLIQGNVNIRARPSDRMPVIHTTAYGTELEVLGRTYQAGMVQWLQVRFYEPNSGRTVVGWIFYNFTDKGELMELKGIVPLDAVPIR